MNRIINNLVPASLILALIGGVLTQAFAQSVQYNQAMQAAQSKDFERAYDLAVKAVSADPSSYDGYVLKIALANLLKKKGPEDPQNLMRVARNYAPIGKNLERDVQTLINRLSGTPIIEARSSIVVSPYVQKKLALVVGIGKFSDKEINPLSFAANDARSFSETLKQDCGFNEVKTLIDEAATRYNIQSAINLLAKTSGPEDLVVIYIASHGSPENMDMAGVNYIVTYDSEIDNLYTTAFKMDDLLNDIQRRIPAERVVAFIDTCYSGATFKTVPSGWTTGSRGLRVNHSGIRTEAIQEKLQQGSRDVTLTPASSANPQRMPQGIGRVIVAASRQDEKSWESDQLRHGYFTYYLIEALKQRGGLSVQDLYDSLSSQVSKAVQRDKNASQNPTMVKSVDGPARIFLREPANVK